MKVYILNHNIMHEGSTLVGIYASRSKADAEALRCKNEYLAERQTSWNSLSKTSQKMLGPMNRYLDIEGYSVEEYDLIED